MEGMGITLTTLLHSDNRQRVLTAILMGVVLLSSYTGTLPAFLSPHKATIDTLSYLILGLNLVHMDPKRELHE